MKNPTLFNNYNISKVPKLTLDIGLPTFRKTDSFSYNIIGDNSVLFNIDTTSKKCDRQKVIDHLKNLVYILGVQAEVFSVSCVLRSRDVVETILKENDANSICNRLNGLVSQGDVRFGFSTTNNFGVALDITGMTEREAELVAGKVADLSSFINKLKQTRPKICFG